MKAKEQKLPSKTTNKSYIEDASEYLAAAWKGRHRQPF